MTSAFRHGLLLLAFWLGMVGLACHVLEHAVSSSHTAYRLSKSGFVGMESICASPGSPLAAGTDTAGRIDAGHCTACGGAAGFALPARPFVALLLLHVRIGRPQLPVQRALAPDRRALRQLAARPPPRFA
jgi:hypothetical protein